MSAFKSQHDRDLLKVGRSADLRVGQSVFSIGSPYGFSKTFTAGVVSGLNRGVPSPAGTIVTGAVQVCTIPRLLHVSKVWPLHSPRYSLSAWKGLYVALQYSG